MVDVVLVVTAVVMTLMILLASVYLLVYFQHEDDKNVAWAPKIAVVLSLTLTATSVLLLPLDVANQKSNGQMPMQLLYQILYVASIVMATAVVPFLIFYYEAWDPEKPNGRLRAALCYETITCIVTAILLAIMWLFLGFADIPVTEFVFNGTLLDAADNDLFDCGLPTGCPAPLETEFRISVTPVVYVMAMASFVGWFLFTLFGGIGLAALPVDLILAYKSRPMGIDLVEFTKQKSLINARATKLAEVGHQLGSDAHRARKGRQRVKFNKFKQAVYFLERDWDKVQLAYKARGGQPIRYALLTFLGVVALLLSLFWAIHLILFNLVRPPPTNFLNSYFEILDGVFPLFGTISYGVFSFYLLLCVIKGCIKFGLRCFCIAIHPMVLGKTLMNSFLFNVWMLLVTSFAVVQLCATTFGAYARFTTADNIFGLQAENLIFLRYFYRNDAFIYALLVIAGLSSCVLGLYPREQRQFESEDDT